MKKTFKTMIVGCVAVMLFASLCFSVCATCARQYGSATVTIDNGFLWGKDTSVATITRCDCSPVDNHLEVWNQIQYEEDGQYYWLPEVEDTYYYDSVDNADEATCTIEHSNIVYAQALFAARCGDGDMITFVDEAIN